ncbi:Tas protein, an NADP(H)-dependent aldo-keto reductase [hydrothermal vent metagenome]|uniref:Tas protein, an NADP(H)-dependent aldo-keto reductase n=1 Tax=hydrothermal vent metagenome TaxID=652676 RepID=A0A3B0XZA1_9ZZZZ
MEYRKLGRTNLDISVIGLGTMTWGFQNTQTEGFEQMDYALERGVNFFDTAEMYAIPPTEKTFGTTETIIGNWFTARNNRDKVVLASKIAGPGLPWIREGKSYIDKKNILQALEGSLQRLKTDYIDLYQLHWPNRGSYHFGQLWGFSPKFDAQAEEENFLEVLHVFDTLIKDGKIRHIGLSNETAWGMTKWLHLAEQNNLPRMAAIQNEYSLLCRHFEPDLSEIAIHENCGLLAWSPLTRGMLSGKYLDGARPEGARITIETRAEHRVLEKTEAAIKKYVELAKQFELDVCQMALSFVNNQPFVNSTLIGATNMTQLKTDIDSISLTLSQEVYAEIDKIRREFPVLF